MPNKNLNSNLDQINKLKSFSASISSEVMNPLLAIKSTCQTLIDNLEEMTQMVYLVSDASNRALLDIQIALQNSGDEKIDKSKFIDLSIGYVVDEAISKYFFKDRREIDLLNVDLEDDFVFKGDENLMSFVILNLLKNALVFQVKIHIWLNSKEKCLYFCDKGIGICEEKLMDIFNEHKSDLQNPTRSEERIGLGLPFCRRVMRDFGGDISCRSKKGEGVEFCLNFG